MQLTLKPFKKTKNCKPLHPLDAAAKPTHKNNTNKSFHLWFRVLGANCRQYHMHAGHPAKLQTLKPYLLGLWKVFINLFSMVFRGDTPIPVTGPFTGQNTGLDED